jgi:hypothetical protein
MFQETAPKHMGGGSHPHGHARMSRISLVGSVYREKPDGVDGQLVGLIKWFGHDFPFGI